MIDYYSNNQYLYININTINLKIKDNNNNNIYILQCHQILHMLVLHHQQYLL